MICKDCHQEGQRSDKCKDRCVRCQSERNKEYKQRRMKKLNPSGTTISQKGTLRGFEMKDNGYMIQRWCLGFNCSEFVRNFR